MSARCAAANQIDVTNAFQSTCLDVPLTSAPNAGLESTKRKISSACGSCEKACHNPHTAAISSHVPIC
eukprot:2043101-Pyramimonas_sp.AAC.1